MSDLISRQALLEDFKKTITEQSDVMDWLNMIARQPIAYDVDKVVEQIESLDLDGYTMLEDGKYYLIRKVDALSAVKEGGVNE